MINKFLYELDEKNRKTIVAVVEDELEGDATGRPFPMFDVETYKPKDNEKITGNYGPQVFMAFKDEKTKYLDIDTYNNEVKISLTENLTYAASFSREFMGVLLFNCNYFGYDDSEEIKSGVMNDKRGKKDMYDKFFKKASDKSYCQIRKEGKVYFVCSNEEKAFYLDQDFSKATRIYKNELRKVLILNHFINEKTDRLDLSFSPYNCFFGNGEYLFAGFNPLKVTFNDNRLTIMRDNVNITIDDKLINNDDKAFKLKDLYSVLRKENDENKSILEVDDLYVQYNQKDYRLDKNPKNASFLSDKEIESFKLAYGLFNAEAKFNVYGGNSNYLIKKSEEEYIVSDIIDDSLETKLITGTMYADINKYFLNGFDPNNRKNGVLLLKEGKYLKVNLSLNVFKLEWLDTAFEATVFKNGEAHALISLLKLSVNKKEIKNLITEDLSAYNIEKNDSKNDVLDMYGKVVDSISTKKHRICSYDGQNIKVESEKGALEYLRRHLIKSVLDAKSLYEEILERYSPKNILVVGAGPQLDLIALNDLDIDINYSAIDISKWGYIPKINISNKVNYKELYRLNFNDLPKSILNQYDLIVFTKTWIQEVISPKDVLCFDNDVILANLRVCNLEKATDIFYESFKKTVSLKRKYFKNKQLIDSMGLDFSKDIDIIKNACKCQTSDCKAPLPIINDENSYHSVIVKNGDKLIDFYTK